MKKILLVLLFLSLVMVSYAKGISGTKFRVVHSSDPTTLDPHKIDNMNEYRIYSALFEGLFRVNPETGEAEPALAESWTLSPDKTVYSIRLKPDLVWSDGTPITAETVRDSWLRLLDPKNEAHYAWVLSMFIKGAKAYSESLEGEEEFREKVKIRVVTLYDLEFETVVPLPYTIQALTHVAFAVLPMHVIEEYETSWTFLENFVNNGPFIIDKWIKNKEIKMEQNELYWDKENQTITDLYFYTEKDPRKAVNYFLFNDADWAPSVPIEIIDKVIDEQHLQVNPIYGTYYYEFNEKISPTNSTEVRKALSLAIDREALAEQFLVGYGIPAYKLVPSLEKDTPPNLVEDIELANQLLDDAGFTKREKFPSLKITYNKHQNNIEIAKFIAEQWKTNLNINVELDEKGWTDFKKARADRKFDIIRSGWISTYQDPHDLLDVFTSKNELNNHGGFFNYEFDELMKQSMNTEKEERQAMLQEAEKTLLNDAGLIPIYHFASYDLINLNKWGGWFPNMMQMHPFESIYRIKGGKRRASKSTAPAIDAQAEAELVEDLVDESLLEQDTTDESTEANQ